MRLVCPNCSAQYEVDAGIIPVEGRDVQCSNCGHTWFETRKSDTQPVAPPPEPVVNDAPETEPEPEIDEPVEAVESDDDDGFSPAARAMAAATDAADQVEDTFEDTLDAEEVFGPEVTPVRRGATAEDMRLLREEADREIAKRRALPSGAFETQADLGVDLDSQRTPSRALRARQAHRGEATSAPPPEAPKPSPAPSVDTEDQVEDNAYQEPQRDLLPDIDEINSSLRQEVPPEKAAKARRKSGFRFGFFLTILIAVGLILTYAYAPAIARVLPEAEPPLISYVDMANRARDWVDGLIASVQ